MGKVTAVMMDTTHEGSGHTCIGMAVSVCLTPAAPAPLPIPYPTVGSISEGVEDCPMRTLIEGKKILTVGGAQKKCHGNEPGTLGEVVSLTTANACFPIMGAPIVFIELGMAGITLSFGQMNKNGAGVAAGSASGAGGAGGGGGGAGGSGGPGGDAQNNSGPSNGGGAGGSDTHAGASATAGPAAASAAAPPGTSSGPAGEHQCQGGHPVDLVSGNVVDQATDLHLPGVIPLVFKRFYSSARRRDDSASLGPGWAHGFEQRIEERGAVLVLREEEGREVYLEKVAVGASTFHRRERITVRSEAPGRYSVFRLRDRLTHEFQVLEGGGPARLSAIKDSSGNAIVLRHDEGRLAAVTDTAGREVRVLWDGSRIRRLEVRVSGSLEQWVDYAYSRAEPRCLVAVVDALGNADRFAYDKGCRMTAATVKTGATFTYEYDKRSGRCVKTKGPDGLYELELEYDDAAKTTLVGGEEPVVYTWNELGLPVKRTTLDGEVLEEVAYDSDGLVIAEVNGAGEGTQHWYDARGNRVRSVDASGNTTLVDFDERDLPVRRTSPDGLVTTYAHDERGLSTRVSLPSGDFYAYARDRFGRLVEVQGASGRIRALEYDARHDLVAETDARGARHAYTYDALGRATMLTDALGRVTRAVHDRMGRPITLNLPDGTTLQRSYDALGHVVRETDALGRTTTFERTGMGVVTKLVPPDGKAWTFGHTKQERLASIRNPRGEVTSFTYDEAGRVTAERGFDGAETSYRYDAAGRVARVTYADQSHQSFTYDRSGNLLSDEASDGSRITCRRARSGRLAGAILEEKGQAPVTLELEYDALGRVVAERQGDRVVRYAADAQGRRTERLMPDGARTLYAYDAAGALSAVDHDGYRLAFERDALGREIARSGEAPGREGRVTMKSSYDAGGRLLDQRVTAPSPMAGVPAAVVQRNYQYDRAGKIARTDDARWGAAAYAHDRGDRLLGLESGSHRTAFAYDEAGALVAALEKLGARGPSEDERWEIAAGNRLTRTDRARYSYDARGRRVAKVDLAATRDGAPSGEPRVTRYSWDARDRLRAIELPDGTRVAYRHDPVGRRVRKEITRPGAPAPRVVDLVWDDDELGAEIDSEAGARTFVHAPGTFVPLLQQEGRRGSERGEIFVYVCDHLGAPRELVDQAGLLAWSASPSAWGTPVEVRADPLAEQARKRQVSSPFRLPGQIADEEAGLTFTKHRVFDPEVGRWLSADPLGWLGGRDLYAFDGSPAAVVDPLGLMASGNPHGANRMQSEVLRGQAPRDVARVDKPHVPGQQAHVHYTDGTSSNVDGSTHDQHQGQPDPSSDTRKWLQGHGWTPPP